MSNFVSILFEAAHKKHYAYIKKSALVKFVYVELIVKCSNYQGKME